MGTCEALQTLQNCQWQVLHSIEDMKCFIIFEIIFKVIMFLCNTKKEKKHFQINYGIMLHIHRILILYLPKELFGAYIDIYFLSYIMIP